LKSTIKRLYQLICVNAYSFGMTFMWNAIHPILLPLLIQHIVPESQKNTSLGLLTSIGLLVAMVIQPVSGALSDSTHHRWGRRRPWLLAGTLGDFVFLLVLALSRSYWVVAIGYVGLQISSNLAHGANQGLIPDLIPENRRGEAAGIKSVVEVLALVAATVIVGRMALGNLERQISIFFLVGGILGISLITTWTGIRRMPETEQTSAFVPKNTLKDNFRINLKDNRPYVNLMAARFLLLFGVYAIQAFALYFFQDVLFITNPSRLVGRVLGVIGIGILVIAYPAGIILERYGRRVTSLACSALCAAGIVILLTIRNITGVYIAGGALGAGLGIFYTVNWAWATTLVPAAEAGKYLGLSNLATAGSGAIVRALGPLIDLANRTGQNLGYFVIFSLALIAVLFSMWFTARIPEAPTASTDTHLVTNVFIAQ